MNPHAHCLSRALFGLLVLCTAQAAWADMQALLVGVSGYPSLPEHRLSGPRNDVQRMKTVLAGRGFAPARINVLADGVPGAAAPTRSNILLALEGLARSSKAGDTVMLYFSGHGSQQPVLPGSRQAAQESDGWHEIFLPIDIGRWDGQRGAVTNAIVDHELRAAVDKIQDRGAFVWGVFDTCHSATLVRGADEEMRYRAVQARDLGVPQAATPATAKRAMPDGTAPAPAGRGEAVFFYAAQTTEQTPEMKLPLGAPNRQPYGLFSFVLSRALELEQPMTYRQMGQYVLAQYTGINAARATPLFTGTGLDRPVLGQTSPPVRQWPVDPMRLSVPVGELSGIGTGTVFRVLPSPLSRDSEVLGYLQVTRAQLERSELAPLAHGGKALLHSDSIRPGWYARLVSRPERLALRIAVDASHCGRDCVWLSVLDRLKQQGLDGVAVEWVRTGADVTLQLNPDEVLALSNAEAPECGLGASLPACVHGQATPILLSGAGERDPQRLATSLRTALQSVARSTHLLRLAASQATRAPSTGLAISLESINATSAQRQLITADKATELRAGDRLTLTLNNRGNAARDVTALYLDARYGIQVIFPRGGESNRLEAGATQSLDLMADDSAPGIERLIVISVEARRLGERADFSFLAQPALASSAAQLTRGTEHVPPSGKADMRVFTFRMR